MLNKCADCKHWAAKNRETSAYAPCSIGVGRTAFNDTCKAFEPVQGVSKAGNIGYHPSVRDYSGERG